MAADPGPWWLDERAHAMTSADRGARPTRRLLVAGAAALSALALAACGGEEPYQAGLIIKQDTNPFFEQIRVTAERLAAREGMSLHVLVGKSDVDNLSQELALGSMVRRGVKGVLITPVDSRRVVPSVEEAQQAGVTVIALDTPTDPETAADALFATDNRKAGELIGRYARAKAAELGLVPKIAMLDGGPGIGSGVLRHEGFLEGFGIEEGDPLIAGQVDTEGNEAKARRGMTRLLSAHPDINVVYTINEPAAFGAAAALRAAGKAPANVVIVSVDGGCQAIRRGVRPGLIDATAQQYPERMAQGGIEALAAIARGGPKPSGYHDTGIELITADPAARVASRDVTYGLDNCWG
jgi:fructose transport system substrate-binding protein